MTITREILIALTIGAIAIGVIAADTTNGSGQAGQVATIILR